MTAVTVPGSTIGSAVNRVDGKSKVRGEATYAADTPIPNVAHAVLVRSTIVKGRVLAIDETATRAIPGVLEVITHRNVPKLNAPPFNFPGAILPGEQLAPLQSDRIEYGGQYVAVVVADTIEHATLGAQRLVVEYAGESAALDVDDADSFLPEQMFGNELQIGRGDVETGLARADVHIDETYRTPYEHHLTIEPSATLALWNGDEVTLHDSTQFVIGARNTVAAALAIAPENVHVISPFVGGGFGGKGFVWPHLVLSAVAARMIDKPVKLVLTREQTFTGMGHRSPTEQRLRIGAKNDGTLTALAHESRLQTSVISDFTETAGVTSSFLYRCPNVRVEHRTYRLNVATPSPVRAPGETPGMFALESALDELAARLSIDPIELRLRNDALRDEQENVPFSSKHLRECYAVGAERFGWSRRAPVPRAMRDGNELIGLGMATATYPALRSPAQAKITIGADDHFVVATASHDLGTGTYTVMTQIAAETLGVEIDRVTCRLGDSTFPKAPVAGGSQSAASVGPAVAAAAEAIRTTACALASATPGSPLFGERPAGLESRGGRIVLKSDPSRGVGYGELATLNGGEIEAVGSAQPASEANLHFQSFGAQFVEVRVDESIGRIRLVRCLGVFDCGRVLNPKTARSQLMGGIVWGIGQALTEETVLDPRGRFVNENLADYHIPVNADIPPIEIGFVEEPDYAFNPLGVRGMGEIGITGVAAAIANAVYHATGRRLRDLPLTCDRLLG